MTPTERLAQIKERLEAIGNDTYDIKPIAMFLDLKWAITRVETLEKALNKIKEHYNYGGKFNEMDAYRELTRALLGISDEA